jgi:hypothetical protein
MSKLDMPKVKSYKRDTLKMVKEIDRLVDNDWFGDIESRALPNSKPFTQQEAEEMLHVIGQVYLISHAIHCDHCGEKYRAKS